MQKEFMLAIVAHFIYIFVQWHSNAFQTNSNSMGVWVCVCVSIDTIALSFIFLWFCSPFLFPRLFRVCKLCLCKHAITAHMHVKESTAHQASTMMLLVMIMILILMTTALMTMTMIFSFYAKFSLSLLCRRVRAHASLSQHWESLLKYLPNTFIRY